MCEGCCNGMFSSISSDYLGHKIQGMSLTSVLQKHSLLRCSDCFLLLVSQLETHFLGSQALRGVCVRLTCWQLISSDRQRENELNSFSSYDSFTLSRGGV